MTNDKTLIGNNSQFMHNCQLDFLRSFRNIFSMMKNFEYAGLSFSFYVSLTLWCQSDVYGADKFMLRYKNSDSAHHFHVRQLRSQMLNIIKVKDRENLPSFHLHVVHKTPDQRFSVCGFCRFFNFPFSSFSSCNKSAGR